MIITLGPWRICVDLTSLEDLDGCYGDWDLNTKTIRVRDSLDGLELSSTLIHELTHAVSDLAYLRLSEQSVRAVEANLVQFIRDHPDLCHNLIQAISHQSQNPNDPNPRRTEPSGASGGECDAAPEPDAAPPTAPPGGPGSPRSGEYRESRESAEAALPGLGYPRPSGPSGTRRP